MKKYQKDINLWDQNPNQIRINQQKNILSQTPDFRWSKQHPYPDGQEV
ncbi:hypothetical protein [Bartonella sp. DGB1]